jgi:hypothetical protein
LIEKLSICQTAGGFPAISGKNIMTREEFARFLKKLKDVKEKGQDIDAFVKKYEHRNVYFITMVASRKFLPAKRT